MNSLLVNFVVEDGSGLSTATSYASLQEANDYLNSVFLRTSWLSTEFTDDHRMGALKVSYRKLRCKNQMAR